ncbi:hypothetical protein B0H13DRAFT_1924817 [Mycena leptocephala]|nr:hypothetical protein B0H13DRAFT_1924817 [Mycena leptocephala]
MSDVPAPNKANKKLATIKDEIKNYHRYICQDPQKEPTAKEESQGLHRCQYHPEKTGDTVQYDSDRVKSPSSDWFQCNPTKIERDMRESVAEFKKCPNREIFVRAFGSDISCNRRKLGSKAETCKQESNSVLAGVSVRSLIAPALRLHAVGAREHAYLFGESSFHQLWALSDLVPWGQSLRKKCRQYAHELENDKWEQIREAENIIEAYDRMIVQVRDSGVLTSAGLLHQKNHFFRLFLPVLRETTRCYKFIEGNATHAIDAILCYPSAKKWMD